MTHAIIRGKNGRRYEVDFGDSPVRVEVHASEETVEIFIEADFAILPEERRRFALLNIPRHLFSKATAAVARRATNLLNFRSDERFRLACCFGVFIPGADRCFETAPPLS